MMPTTSVFLDLKPERFDGPGKIVNNILPDTSGFEHVTVF
jgi:hypothetical protein